MVTVRGRAPTIATVAAGFVLYGALFTDRLAPLFLASRIGRDLGVGSGALAWLPFAIAIGWTLGLAAGRWSNRYLTLRQRVLVGTAITALASGASVLAPGWGSFLLLRALGGIGANVASPAVIALCVRATPPARRGTALGIVQSATRVAGSFLAPIALTAVVAVAGWRWALLGAAATLLFANAGAQWLLPRAGRSTATPAGSRPPVFHPRSRGILTVASSAAVLTFLWLTLISQGGVPLLERWLEIDIAAAGRLVGWFGAGSTVGALGVSAWSDRGRGLALGVAGLVTAGAGSGLALAVLLDARPATWVVALAIGLSGLGLGAVPMAISILPSDAVVAGDVDRAVEIPIMSAELLGAATLPALALALAARIGLEWLLLATAAAFAVLAVVGGGLLHRWLPPQRSVNAASADPPARRAADS